jgi:glutamine amidotransferase
VKIAVVKYNAGNIHSVRLALRRLGIEPLITDDAGELKRADKVIFPGVGEARSAMAYLRQHGLDTVMTGLRQPVLGICLGLQLMCQHSEENDTRALGIFAENVLRFPPREKVPHMGWNSISGLRGALFDRVPDGSYVYFVHSFYADTGSDTTATTDYILPFSSALCKDNFYAVQFHPEKSGETGSQILRNFISL